MRQNVRDNTFLNTVPTCTTITIVKISTTGNTVQAIATVTTVAYVATHTTTNTSLKVSLSAKKIEAEKETIKEREYTKMFFLGVILH